VIGIERKLGVKFIGTFFRILTRCVSQVDDQEIPA
jgi:hypothetical protein